VTVVIATEDGKTIVGLLAYRSDAGQKAYCIWLLNRLRALGYTGLTKAEVLVFFTEADEHAQLVWTKTGGYSFHIYDRNLSSSGISPRPTQTPLPTPSIP
jgi:hypothetical protein